MAERSKETTLSRLGLTALGGRDAPVTGIAVDSRLVREGNLFAALPGTRVHGAEFVPVALRQGAGSILTDRAGAELAREVTAKVKVPVVVCEDPRAVLAFACAIFFGAQPEVMVAVTGT